ncbi:MAG: hypothetical protein ACK4LB_07950 [Spirosomataceae bacterium]
MEHSISTYFFSLPKSYPKNKFLSLSPSIIPVDDHPPTRSLNMTKTS